MEAYWQEILQIPIAIYFEQYPSGVPARPSNRRSAAHHYGMSLERTVTCDAHPTHCPTVDTSILTNDTETEFRQTVCTDCLWIRSSTKGYNSLCKVCQLTSNYHNLWNVECVINERYVAYIRKGFRQKMMCQSIVQAAARIIWPQKNVWQMA